MILENLGVYIYTNNVTLPMYSISWDDEDRYSSSLDMPTPMTLPSCTQAHRYCPSISCWVKLSSRAVARIMVDRTHFPLLLNH